MAYLKWSTRAILCWITHIYLIWSFQSRAHKLQDDMDALIRKPFDEEKIITGIFNIEDTAAQINKFSKESIENSNFHNTTYELGKYCPTYTNSDQYGSEFKAPKDSQIMDDSFGICNQYCEFLLGNVIYNSSFPETPPSLLKIYNLLVDIKKGFLVRWKSSFEPISGYISMILRDSNFKILYEYSMRTNQQYNQLISYGLLISFLLLTFFLLSKIHHFKTSVKKAQETFNEKELIENMLKRINWFCEQTQLLHSSNTEKEGQNSRKLVIFQETLNHQLQNFGKHLEDLDSQLQNLDHFATLMTNVFRSLEQEFASLSKERQEFYQATHLPHPLSNFLESEYYRAGNSISSENHNDLQPSSYPLQNLGKSSDY